MPVNTAQAREGEGLTRAFPVGWGEEPASSSFSGGKMRLHSLKVFKPKHNAKRLGFIFPRRQVDTAYNLDNSLDSMAWKRPLYFYPLFYLLQCSTWWTVWSWPEESQPLVVLTTATTLGNRSRRVSVKKELEAEERGRGLPKHPSLTLLSPQSATDHTQSCPSCSSGNPFPKKEVGQSQTDF